MSEDLGVDERPFDAALHQPVLHSDVANMIASLHLAHESWPTTVGVVKEVASRAHRDSDGHVDAEGAEQYATALEAQVRALLVIDMPELSGP